MRTQVPQNPAMSMLHAFLLAVALLSTWLCLITISPGDNHAERTISPPTRATAEIRQTATQAICFDPLHALAPACLLPVARPFQRPKTTR